MARGDSIAVRDGKVAPETLPSPERVLMVHPGKGYRWIPKELQKAKEKWGYEFVREYADGDEIMDMPLDQMTPEQLHLRAEAMVQLADDKEERAKGKAEKEFRAKKKADEEDAKRRADRAGKKGLAK